MKQLRGSSATLLFLAASLLVFFAGESAAKTFNCSSRSTCHALVGYAPHNDTSLSQVQALFGVKNLRSLLGANGLPAATPPSFRVPANHTISILFQCVCGSNGSATGTSHGRPVYVVRKGDFAYEIATSIFSGLVTYEEIAAANGLPDPSRIDAGQRLQIPLPCSCDKVNGSDVVHYGHVVAAGSTVREIAAEFGTDETTLMGLNGIADPKDLLAGDVLDVPLKGPFHLPCGYCLLLLLLLSFGVLRCPFHCSSSSTPVIVHLLSPPYRIQAVQTHRSKNQN